MAKDTIGPKTDMEVSQISYALLNNSVFSLWRN